MYASSNLVSALCSSNQKVLKDRGIDSMVKEAREDNRENDAEHMKPVRYSSQVDVLMTK